MLHHQVTTTRVLVCTEFVCAENNNYHNVRFEVVVGHQSFRDLLHATVGCMALVHRYKFGWVPVSAVFVPVVTNAAAETAVGGDHAETTTTCVTKVKNDSFNSEAEYRELRARGPRSYYLDAKIVCSCLPGQSPQQSDDLFSFSKELFSNMCIAMPSSWLLLPCCDSAAVLSLPPPDAANTGSLLPYSAITVANDGADAFSTTDDGGAAAAAVMIASITLS